MEAIIILGQIGVVVTIRDMTVAGQMGSANWGDWLAKNASGWWQAGPSEVVGGKLG